MAISAQFNAEISKYQMSLLIRSRFLHQERLPHKELQLALEKSRKKYTITPQDLNLIDRCSARDLCCIIHFARGWSKPFWNDFEAILGFDDLDALLPNNRESTFLDDKLRYLLKSPKRAYRIYKTERMIADGELVPCFRQGKSELRKGDRITLFHLMKDLRLPELAAAGGEGTDMMRRIKRRTVRVHKSRD